MQPDFLEVRQMWTDAAAVAVGCVAGFAGWCIRVELRLHHDRQSLEGLAQEMSELRLVTKVTADEMHRHGEMLAAIKASLDFITSGLRDVSVRLERLGDRTL
jgi:hypothetical protein